MRWRRLKRHLGIGTPRVDVAPALAWPLRWALALAVLALAAAMAWWAFQQGKQIAGLEMNLQAEAARLRELAATQAQALEQAKTEISTAKSQAVAFAAEQDQLVAQIRRLESENQGLRADLDFFERLIPTSGRTAGVQVRSVFAERLGQAQLRWQVLLMQTARNPSAASGELEVVLVGKKAGKPWSMPAAAERRTFSLVQYVRLEGLVAVPAQVTVQSVVVKLWQGKSLRGTQTFVFES
jgi:hypothetical protein